jgi:hypothetical protein
MFGQQSSERRCTCFAGHKRIFQPCVLTRIAHVSGVRSSVASKSPCIQIRGRFGNDSTPPSSPPTSRGRHHYRFGHAIGIIFLVMVSIFSRMASGRFVSMRVHGRHGKLILASSWKTRCRESRNASRTLSDGVSRHSSACVL